MAENETAVPDPVDDPAPKEPEAPEDAKDDDEPEAPPTFDAEAAAKTAEQTARSTQNDVAELKRSIGLFQSLLDKQANAAKETGTHTQEMRTQATQQQAATAEVLKAVLAGQDQEAMPADARQRVASALARIDEMAASNQRDDFINEIMAKMDERITQAAPAPAPVDNGLRDQLKELEEATEKEIRSYNLDPDDAAIFDWGQASTILNGQGVDAYQDYIRTQIRTGMTADGADTRRQTRKQDAAEAPRSTGPVKTDEQKFADGEMDVKDGVEYLRNLGLPV